MRVGCLLVSLLYLICNLQLHFAKDIDADAFAQLFYEHFKRYFETNETSRFLDGLRDEMIHAQERSIKLIDFPVNANSRVCLKCYVVAHSFIRLTSTKIYSDDKIKAFMNKLCIYGDIDSQNTCEGSVDINFASASFIFGSKLNLTAEYVCERIMPEFFCVKNDDNYEHALIIEKPSEHETRENTKVESSGQFTVLHLSDFHYDRYYASGSNAECEDWVCCRGEELPPDSKFARAGYWGDYHLCDSPGRLAENILQNVAALKRNVDFAYFTGDFADHFGWNLTREHCQYEIKFVTDLLKRYLPNVPVFPVLGNHEGYPANFFAPNYIKDKELSSKWLYEFVAEEWKPWLTNEAYESLASKGYYTMIVKPNLRLIAMNSNVCNVDNLWIVYDELFYQEQLLWFIDILKHASDIGERVHIIGHIASNHERCNRKWAYDFRKIIERYSHVIAGHFNGHSHVDEFVVYYSSEDPNKALSVAWNGGSGTHFVGLNSNFKLYSIDSRTYNVLDFETWIFNLTEANFAPGNEPVWYKEYSFKSLFGVDDLSPSSIDGLLKRFRTNKDLLKEYWKVVVKQSDVAIARGCDEKCLEAILDNITRTTFPKLNIYKRLAEVSPKNVVPL